MSPALIVHASTLEKPKVVRVVTLAEVVFGSSSFKFSFFLIIIIKI